MVGRAGAGAMLCVLLGGFLLLLGVARADEPPLPEGTNLWRFPLFTDYKDNVSQSAPALAPDGTVYAGSLDGTLFAVTPAGLEKWRFKAGLEIKSSPAIADDGTIYFGSRDRFFYALTPAGKLKWRFATGAWVDASPAIATDGTIYFGSWDKIFYALNPDGSLKWKYVVGAIVDGSPAIAADGTIYFGAHDKNFYALNPDGKMRWTFATGGPVIASPAIGTGGLIYFSSLDGNLYALNPDGTEHWRCHTGSITESSPVIDTEGNLSIGLNDRTQVVSPAGKALWHRGSPLPVEVAALAVPGRFYFSAPWRTVQSLEAPDHLLWLARLNENVSASLVMDDQGIIYVCTERCLYAIRPPGELLPPAKSPWPMFHANARHTGRVALEAASAVR